MRGYLLYLRRSWLWWLLAIALYVLAIWMLASRESDVADNPFIYDL